MFSGKSEELIRRLRRAVIARKRVQVFKPAIDNRYSISEIVTHADVRMRSEPVNSSGEILAKLDWRTQVVGVDESNFFGPELVAVANQLADGGKQVIIAGLDTDFMGRPFMPDARIAGGGGIDHENAGYLHALWGAGEAYAAADGFGRFDHGRGAREPMKRAAGAVLSREYRSRKCWILSARRAGRKAVITEPTAHSPGKRL